MSVGSIQYHFPNRVGLMIEVYQALFLDMLNQTEARIKKVNRSAARLRQTLHHHLRWAAQESHQAVIILRQAMRFDAELASRAKFIAEHNDQSFRSMWSRYAEEIGLEPGELERLTDLLILASNSIGFNVHLAAGQNGCHDIETSIQLFQAMLFNLIDAEMMRCLR